MLLISPDVLAYYRGQKSGRLLFSFDEGDIECTRIYKDIVKLEIEIGKIIGVHIPWKELKDAYEIPECINRYTVFFLRNSLTIGTINNPTYEELTEFYQKCNDNNYGQLYGFLIREHYKESDNYYSLKYQS